jgi:UDP-GlcNAc:undecaprenyl-phosphate/decaprenyl-phosphate GlcNAc-1-phosphate transferase
VHALVAAAVVVTAALLTYLLVPVSRFVAVRFGVMDVPGQRKVHAAPMPRLGGLAVYLGFTVTVLIGYCAVPLLDRAAEMWPALVDVRVILRESGRVWDKLAGLLAGATLAFAIGLVDDVFGTQFPPALKALGQIAAAGLLILGGVQTALPIEAMNLVVTVLWVVGITNSFNFLDNMDGLSSGVAAVACLILLLNAWSRGEFFIVLLIAALLGSLLGFLKHNFHPASVFLGDCGSLFIGFTVAALTLLERYVSHASSSLFPVLMPILVLGVPLLDTATVVFIRLREHRPVYVGDKRHLSHRLVSIGFSTRRAVLSIYLAAFAFGLGATVLPDATFAQSILVVTQALAFASLLLVLMFHERREPASGEGG